jgi:hypothetical protein
MFLNPYPYEVNWQLVTENGSLSPSLTTYAVCKALDVFLGQI